MHEPSVEGASVIVEYLLAMYDTLKLYHWSTTSFARHSATDELVQEVLKTTDRLVEVYLGRYGRPVYPTGLTMRIRQLSDVEAVAQLREYGRWLKTDFLATVKANDTDILNLRDELMSSLHQALYRYTLH